MDYILHTPVKIGEKLPNEFELAELFGVGRSTVRETVKSLVSKGVLEVRRGSGTYVIGTNRLEDDPLGLQGLRTNMTGVRPLQCAPDVRAGDRHAGK